MWENERLKCSPVDICRNLILVITFTCGSSALPISFTLDIQAGTFLRGAYSTQQMGIQQQTDFSSCWPKGHVLTSWVGDSLSPGNGNLLCLWPHPSSAGTERISPFWEGKDLFEISDSAACVGPLSVSWSVFWGMAAREESLVQGKGWPQIWAWSHQACTDLWQQEECAGNRGCLQFRSTDLPSGLSFLRVNKK